VPREINGVDPAALKGDIASLHLPDCAIKPRAMYQDNRRLGGRIYTATSSGVDRPVTNCNIHVSPLP